MSLVSALSLREAPAFRNTVTATQRMTAEHISTAGLVSRDMSSQSDAAAASPHSTGSSEPLSLSYSSIGTSCSDEAGVAPGPGWGRYPPTVDTDSEISAALESRARSDFVVRPIGYGRTVSQHTTRRPDPANLPPRETFSNLQGAGWDGARSLTPAFGSIGQPYRHTAREDFSQPPPSSLHESSRIPNGKRKLFPFLFYIFAQLFKILTLA